MDARERAVDRFRDEFGRPPETLVRSPGRINLIGDHTDYNDGLVLPLAIEPALWLASSPAGRVTVVSADEPGTVVVDQGDPGGDRMEGWGAYVQGVAWAAEQAGTPLEGMDAAVASDIPVGAGLSSSAALELAVLRALSRSGDWAPPDAARTAQRAENDWVGVDSGIMDQLASAAGRAGHALLIDCRSLDVEHVPIPEALRIVIMDTGTRRELVTSAYNERRRACERAAELLGVAALRDADVAQVDTLEDPVLRRRARHVVTENARVDAAASALRRGDEAELGALMHASHVSLRDDFEVSGPELDAIVEAASDAPGYVGARMTGGGFAGCAVAAVAADAVDAFVAGVSRDYHAATGRDAWLAATQATNGTETLPCV